MDARESGEYYVDALGDPETSAITEIERYCVEPGQASAICSASSNSFVCATSEGSARRKFDIRQFHDAVLLGGAVPLTILEKIVDNYIAAKQSA